MLTIPYEQIGHRWLDYLLRVEAGETIVVLRDDRPVAELKPVSADAETKPSESDYDNDWQSKMTQRVQINVSIDELIEPITDIWEDYV